MYSYEARREVTDAIEICAFLTRISNEIDAMDLDSVREILLGTPLGTDAVNGICNMLENSRDFLFIEKSRVTGVLNEDMDRLRDIGFL